MKRELLNDCMIVENVPFSFISVNSKKKRRKAEVEQMEGGGSLEAGVNISK